MINIDEIMKLLHWNNSHEQQTLGLQYAKNVNCIKCFFQPQGKYSGKPVWENCAVVISEKTDEALCPYFMDMLFWLQDLNWPGAEIILRRLIDFKQVEQLAVLMNRIIPVIHSVNDPIWLHVLSQLLQNEMLAEKLSQTVLDILYRASHEEFE